MASSASSPQTASRERRRCCSPEGVEERGCGEREEGGGVSGEGGGREGRVWGYTIGCQLKGSV